MFAQDHNILVVDDDAAQRRLIASILAEEEFAVTAVGDGLAALRMVATIPVTLIIAALALPGTLDGLVTVRRARLRRPTLKALFTASFATRPVWDDPDSDDFITAPFHRHELLGCVFELLQRQGLAGAADLARRCRAELRAP